MCTARSLKGTCFLGRLNCHAFGAGRSAWLVWLQGLLVISTTPQLDPLAHQAGVAQLGRAMAAGEAEVDAALRRANELYEATAARRMQEARRGRETPC